MRIRRSSTISCVSPSQTPSPSPSPSPSIAPSPSSCSSSSSCFSTTTISTHSLTSSSNSTSSSSSFPPSLSLASNRRCHGLDLLVKAVHYVAGSVVGVPYIQRRVIRHRKPALKFTNFIINSHKFELDLQDEVVDVVTNPVQPSQKKNHKQKRRSKGVPSKYNDSVLQSWKPKDRPRRRSIKG